MLHNLRENLNEGLEKIRWFSSFVSERLRVEVSVFKLLHQMRDLEKKRDERLKDMGRRIFELRSQKGADVLKDTRIRQSIRDTEAFEAEIEAIRNRVVEVGRPETEEAP